MREILFRGQTRRKGEKVRLDGTPVESNWVYGGVAQSIPDRDFSIIYQIDPEIHKFPVYADTIGQYTGLTDKNGKKIFEGDIILSCEYNDIYLVKYFDNENYPAFDCVPYVPFCECNGLSFLVNEEGCEVIGNIHDNPELLKGE